MQLSKKHKEFLHKFAPIWLNFLESNKFENIPNKEPFNNSEINIQNCLTCIVGECYHFESSYFKNCDICKIISIEFFNAIENKDKEFFKRTLTRLMRHIEKDCKTAPLPIWS